MPNSLAVIIISKNEAHDIAACLSSVAWADEIIVLDSGSEDATVSIAQQFTTQVYTNTQWQGFGIQKNRALAYAKSTWVLSIDADEVITPALRAEIEQAIQSATHQVYLMPRVSSYCGQYIRHSGWTPDRVARLFKRGSAEFSQDLVHESLQYQAPAALLKNPILHRSYRNLEEVLDKVNHYSSLGAHNAHNKGKKGSLAKALYHAAWAFIRTYLLRLGFLDGAVGLMLAISNAEVTYYRYLKLYFLQRDVHHASLDKNPAHHAD